jgi:hypothetical protein
MIKITIQNVDENSDGWFGWTREYLGGTCMLGYSVFLFGTKFGVLTYTGTTTLAGSVAEMTILG